MVIPVPTHTDVSQEMGLSPARGESGWLIERQEDGLPQWWVAGSWTKNANEAVRFARQKDAERVIAEWVKLREQVGWEPYSLRATFHLWSV